MINALLDIFNRFADNDDRDRDNSLSVSKNESNITEHLFQAVNQHRMAQRLTVLIQEPRLFDTAQRQSRRLATANCTDTNWHHTYWEDRKYEISRLPQKFQSAAENVAVVENIRLSLLQKPKTQQEIVGEIIKRWLATTGYRANTEGDYTHSGIGVSTFITTDSDTLVTTASVFAVQYFAK
ncbi:CAP domain-containing protein [Microcoleus sp. herbarium7]|uniref:CAP domain-containing protein n=1 Tax=Microcoleus sp. herbarium7 TaxID=3055435 RepID=UPI002FD31714